MRPALSLALIAALIAMPAVARVSIGQYGRWGAFREAPRRCLAAAEPLRRGRHAGAAFVAVTMIQAGGPPRLYVAPSRPLEAGSALRLEVDGRSFTLTAEGVTGRDARDDARIIAAFRRADRLLVSGVDSRGRRFRDDYALAGAPSAIDAAIVACL